MHGGVKYYVGSFLIYISVICIISELSAQDTLTMTKEWQEYVKDPRTVCKYGTKCYQKNPEHHAKYKHPPNNLTNFRGNKNKRRFSPYRRNTPSPKPDADNVEPEDTNDIVPGTSGNIESNSQPESVSENKVIETSLDKSKIKIFDQKNITFYDSTKHEMLQELFMVDMPSDFYKFYECLNEGNSIDKQLSSVNLELIGPYDLLCGKLPVVDDRELYLIHWRFFYDPPEFQSVLKKKGKSEYHIGYFRDDPKEKPAFLASNNGTKDYHIKPLADNIFAAVYIYLQNEKKSSPFTAMACQKLMDKVKKYAEENSFSLEEFNMKKRQVKIVTKSFHGAGIVVPFNKKTQLGYRHLVENDATLKKLFTRLEAAESQKEKDSILSELQPVITYASIAVDECDFGTGIEAGIALFCSGLKELESSALSSLTAAYTVLNREPFSRIIQAHLKYRRKGPNVSLLNISDQ